MNAYCGAALSSPNVLVQWLNPSAFPLWISPMHRL